MESKDKFRIGQRVRFVGHENICNPAKLDVGKYAIVNKLLLNPGYIRISMPSASNGLGYWKAPIKSIKPVEEQLMLFEI